MSNGLVQQFAPGTSSITIYRPGGSVVVPVTVAPIVITPPTSTPTSTVPTATGRSWVCNTSADFTAALAGAAYGDEIVLTAGNVFIGPFTLPAKTGNGWILIRSSASASLPARGTRVHPNDAINMPLIKIANNTDQAIATSLSANGFWLLGLEIGVDPSVTTTYNLMNLGSGNGGVQTQFGYAPQNIGVDRCYVHGHSNVDFQRTIGLNSGATTIIDSHIGEAHATGNDAQAICGWNGPGPYLIKNNYLEGSGETVMFGGADSASAALVPQDITFVNNYCFKPPAWNRTYFGTNGVAGGTGWEVKNHFELKSAIRVLATGNIFENMWGDAQDGTSILFKSVNQGGAAPWGQTSHVMFRDNIMRGAEQGCNLSGNPQNADVIGCNNIGIVNNLWIGIRNRNLLISGINRMLYKHNTSDCPGFGAYWQHDTLPMTQFTFEDNITGGPLASSDGTGYGVGSMLATFVPGWVCRNNVCVGQPSNGTNYNPPGNFAPSSWASLNLNADYSLPSNSPYKNAASDGTDIGANIATILAATAGVDANNKALVGTVQVASSGTSSTAPLTAAAFAAVAHNTIAVAVAGTAASGFAPAITDTAGNTYALAGSAVKTGNINYALYVAYNVVANAANVVQFADVNSTFKEMAVWQFSGTRTRVTPVAKAVQGKGASANGTYATPAVASDEANEVFIIVGGDDLGGTVTVSGAPNPFNVALAGTMRVGYSFVRSTTAATNYTESYTLTSSNAGGTVAGIVAILK